MTDTTAHRAYALPENPDDPEAAALELIVRIPTEVMAEPGRLLHPLIEVLQDFTGMLSVEGAFTGMVWPDAKQIAAAIAMDLCTRDDAGDFLRYRAGNALSGADGMVWRDRDLVARALTLAADLFDGADR